MQKLDYAKVKMIYRALFAPEPNKERVLGRRQSTAEEFNIYTEFTKHLGRKRISLDEFREMIEARGDIKNAQNATIEELREKVTLEDVTDYRNRK